VGDRFDRKLIIKLKRSELAEEKKERWFRLMMSKAITKRRRNWLALMLNIEYVIEDMHVFLMDVFRWGDNKTGLPNRLLENWVFTENIQDNVHGRVFKARDKHGVDCVIKIRDKSIGHVARMPVKTAVHTLHKAGLNKGGLFFCCNFGKCRKLLVRVGLIKEFGHPSLVSLQAVFNSPEFYIEVQEFMRGPSLASWLEDMQSQLDEVGVNHVFWQVLNGVVYLHSKRIIHRAIRMNQILLTSTEKDFDVKLSDFWCLLKMRKGRNVIVFDDTVPVDIATCAPEVVHNGRWTDKADVWSCGCLLFELLYGHPPYGGAGRALTQRVLSTLPEFDKYCGKVSASAEELLKEMFRKHMHRPAAKYLTHHRWFKEFASHEDRTDKKKPRRILKVMIEKAPLFRTGMSPENLLATHTGEFTAGFCTFMGAVNCQLDLVIGGTGETQMYWITSVRVSLWGNMENPKEVVLSMAVRENGNYIDLQKKHVDGVATTEVEFCPNRPLCHARLTCTGNFGGHMGIGLRKIGFFGYEVRPVKIVFNLDKAMYIKGAEQHLHSSTIKEIELNGLIHPSLKEGLEKGDRIVGTGARYYKYRDISSGPEFLTTGIAMTVKPEGSHTLIAATLALRYHSTVREHSQPPRIRVIVESEKMGRIVIFKTDALPCTIWNYDQILKDGYDELEGMYNNELSIPTEEEFFVEVSFENGPAHLYIPYDFGLTFYYMPDIPTPNSEDEEEEHERDMKRYREKKAQEQLHHKQVEDKRGGAEVDPAAVAAAAARIRDADDDVSDQAYEENVCEERLQEDFLYLQDATRFGTWGAGVFEQDECEPWQTGAEVRFDLGDDGHRHYHIDKSKDTAPWWDATATEDDDDHTHSQQSGEAAGSTEENKGAAEPGSVSADTTCPPTMESGLATTGAGTQSKTDSRMTPTSRDHSREAPQSRDDSRPSGAADDEWGEPDEWEAPSSRWGRNEHDGPTDAWGVPIDDPAELEAQQQREHANTAATHIMNEARIRNRAEGAMRSEKIQMNSLVARMERKMEAEEAELEKEAGWLQQKVFSTLGFSREGTEEPGTLFASCSSPSPATDKLVAVNSV